MVCSEPTYLKRVAPGTQQPEGAVDVQFPVFLVTWTLFLYQSNISVQISPAMTWFENASLGDCPITAFTRA